MEKSMSSAELKLFWGEHPDWILHLVVRNFNTLALPLGNPENHRLSVHAMLEGELDSPHEQRLYSNGGIDFVEFFGSEVTQYFPEGMRGVGPMELMQFAEAYTKTRQKLIGVTHQEGGDPADASFSVLGLFENGVNVLDVFHEECMNDRDFAPFSKKQKERLVVGVLFICDKRQWDLFLRELVMYHHGKKMPDTEIEYLRRLGYDGARALAIRAEQKMRERFPALARLCPGKLTAHLLPRENSYDRPMYFD